MAREITSEKETRVGCVPCLLQGVVNDFGTEAGNSVTILLLVYGYKTILEYPFTS